MREGEGDDLAGIGGIGQDFLIAGHGGVEADLAHRLAFGAEAEAFDHRAVGQHQQAGHARRIPVGKDRARGRLAARVWPGGPGFCLRPWD